MTLVELLTHPLAQRLTWTLAHFLWQGFLIAVVLAFVFEVLRIRSASTRYNLSLAALLLMFVALPITWLAIGDQQDSLITAQPIFSAALVHAEDGGLSHETESTVIATSWWITLQPLLLGAWLAGCVLLNLRIVVGWFATHSLLRSRQRLPRETTAQLAGIGWRLQHSISQVVFASEQVSQALAVGFFKPVVLLPAAWLLELPPNLLEAVVAHELAHLRRHDLWVNLLQRVAEAVLFYHPAIWWLSARLRRERELCCDELAVAATGQRLEYAEALELTARWALVDGRPALAAGFFGEGKMNLLHRVRCVLGMSPERPASLWPASLLLGGLSLALLSAIYSVNAQEERPKAKEGERREGEVRRDGDKPAASEADRFLGRTQAEPRREGDRPREGEVRRDGDRPREGEVRRDGDRPRTEGAPRDGERRPDANRPDAPREGARPGVGNNDPRELMAIINQLRAEVTALRAEVTRLKGGSAARKPGEGDIRVEPRREGDRPREGGDRPRTEGGDRPREGGDRPRVEGGDRPRTEGERREGGDRPRPEGERREVGDRPKG